MLAILLALAVNQTPQHRLFLQPNLPRLAGVAPAFFEFLPASGEGLSQPQSLCAQLQPSEKVGDWTCMDGDGTFQGRTLVKSGTDLDSSSYICGGGDTVAASRNPNSSAVWTAVSARTGGADYTTCSVVKPAAIVGEQAQLTWSSSGSGANLGISPYIGAGGTVFGLYYAFGSPCVNATGVNHTTSLVPNAVSVLCTRVANSGVILDLFVNGVRVNASTSGNNIGCDDGSTHRYNINSWAGLIPQANNSPLLGAFATETVLSDQRIQEITNAVLGTSVSSLGGAAISFSRASAGYVTKRTDSLRTTGFQAGDLAMCAIDQPRMQKGSTGIMRALREPATTNATLFSEDFLNAGNWFLASGGSPSPAVPTRTGDVAIGLNGTMTADRLDFPSVTGSGFSLVYAAPRVSTAATYTHSLWVQGVSGSGTIYLMSTPGGPTYNSAACNFTSTSWTRCSVTGPETATNWYLQIGFDLRDGTQSGQGPQSVYVWGNQSEIGFRPTSYIPTQGSTTVRSVDNWKIDLGPSAPRGNAISMAITVEGKGTQEALEGYPSAVSAHSDFFNSTTGKGLWLYSAGSFGTSMRCLGVDDSGSPLYQTDVVGGSSGTIRGWCEASGTITGSWGTAMNPSSAISGGTWSPARYLVLSGTTSSTMGGLFGEVCVDGPSRCR